jgi:hypothetical protein
MAVMARDTWTDERLGDLNKRVDDGFSEMREEFRAMRAELHQLTYGLIGTMLLGFLGTIVALVTQT